VNPCHRSQIVRSEQLTVRELRALIQKKTQGRIPVNVKKVYRASTGTGWLAGSTKQAMAEFKQQSTYDQWTLIGHQSVDHFRQITVYVHRNDFVRRRSQSGTDPEPITAPLQSNCTSVNILLYKTHYSQTKWRHVDECSDDCRDSPDISGNKLFVIRRHVTADERGDWPGRDHRRRRLHSAGRAVCVDYVPVVPEPTPGPARHGPGRNTTGSQELCGRSAVPATGGGGRGCGARSLHIGPGCPLAIGSCVAGAGGRTADVGGQADRRSFDTAQQWAAAACRMDGRVGR